ncbi:hypothetical protein RB195_004059 [Necator americanus]|uniref:alpha-1,6-mannosyl-glycoprotein 6-beta-N-acetylglucosaminyltransferase n=1 Tax=Necator americanus TaxID=51031 RepID=A0ABR1BKB3_NECAM
MRRDVCRLFLLLILVATLPVFILYRQLGYEVTHEQLLSYYRDELTSSTGLNSDASLQCMQFPQDMSSYPHCFEKMQWLRNGWKSHSCYTALGVDGSVCSFRQYLSTVEDFCPPTIFFRRPTTAEVFAETNTDLQRLLTVLSGNAGNYNYIRERLVQHWSSWTEALRKTLGRYPNSMSNRKKLNILIHMGLLTEKNLHIGEKSGSGGPLGELLQWSDLIACLFLLGHNLYISSDKMTLLRHVDNFPLSSPCPEKNQFQLNLIITDIIGLRSFKKRRDFLVHHKCRIRLVDSFGTHVEFNYRSYFNAHQSEFAMEGTKQKNPWGGHGLQLLQHWTFFPHTPDNGFLGLPSSLVYGKEKYMWNESETVINVLKKFTEVHATVADVNSTESPMFSNIINHGFLNASDVASLLKSVDIFVGLGFPFEGPAPLEAIAHGAVFINPKFHPPKSRLNAVFLREKPTLREFTSQSPYMERLGKPYVYTIDINDSAALSDAITTALKEKPKPFVPEEFTPEGMLVRVNMLVVRDLCSKKSVWPPATSLQPVLGAPELSCEKGCESAGLVCEPSFFPLVNSASVLERLVGCTEDRLENSTAPFAPYGCSLQSSSLMFSCASRPPSGSAIKRICPCRDYLPGSRHPNTLHLLAGSSTTTALDAARALLVNGANACVRADEGITPLHVACAYDCLAMAQLLMHYGADPEASDDHGRTPFSMATGSTHRFLQRMLTKSTRDQRGIIHRLFACHTAMMGVNKVLMRGIRRKWRRSLGAIGCRRPPSRWNQLHRQQ